IITEEVRQSDDVLPGAEEESVVRWGGEEFVVVFSQTNRDAAHFAAERIRARIAAELTTVRPNGEAVTISGGLAEYRTAEPSEVDNLLRAADEQLLAAKKSGKNIILPVPERAAA
ncbi:MAG: GGDEF domain-containing protein, partial [Candidatus Kerfeldbacteria bacterium]|nr:GGDEF domain-containing protein [Candidatus Kerfeldbacteria bacterium]